MKVLKELGQIALIIVFFGFMAAALYYTVHGIGSGPIKVIVGDGKYSTIYRTDKVLPAGPGCIKFKVEGDTITACGVYRVRR